jgi:sodium/bile acid cotransporter 7
MKVAQQIKSNWFMLGMALAVLLAWLFPAPGAHGGWLYPEILTKLCVALIFFLHGLSIEFQAMKAGMLRWPVHLVVQGCTFILFPIIGVAVWWLTAGQLPDDLRLGFFYLCALPSTVSSSVAMTAAARGNVPVAVFNASFSSLIGIALTPLLMGLVMQRSDSVEIHYASVVFDLFKWLLLPLILGQLMRPLLGAWAARHKKSIRLADRLTILLLIYTSFCDSVQWGVWSGHSLSLLVWVCLGSVLLFGAVLWVTNAASHRLGLPVDERIAAVFCGSKKSMVQGVPMAHLMFAGYPGLGMLLLPILIYHPLQIVLSGFLASRWAKRSN